MNIKKFESFFDEPAAADVLHMSLASVGELMDYLEGSYGGTSEGYVYSMPVLSTGDQLALRFSDGKVKMSVNGGLMNFVEVYNLAGVSAEDMEEYRLEAEDYESESDFVNIWRVFMHEVGISKMIEDYDNWYEEDQKMISDRAYWMETTGLISYEEIDKFRYKLDND